MNDPQPPRKIGRSILAVLAGIIAGVAVNLATDMVLHAIHLFPAGDQRVPDGKCKRPPNSVGGKAIRRKNLAFCVG